MIDNRLGLYDVLNEVTGWLSKEDAQLLINYTINIRDSNVIVEIGSYRGRSTIVMALYSTVPVYSIDPHQPSVGDPYQFGDVDRGVFCRNLIKFGVSDKVRQINLESVDVGLIFNKPVGFLFVDGSHSYKGVRDDLSVWIPHISKGGHIAFHDYNAPQIQHAIKEFSNLEFIEIADITAIYKVKDNA